MEKEFNFNEESKAGSDLDNFESNFSSNSGSFEKAGVSDLSKKTKPAPTFNPSTNKRKPEGNILFQTVGSINYTFLVWAVSLIILSYGWLFFGKPNGVFTSLSTAWFPKVGIAFGLLFAILFVFKLASNKKAFMKDVFDSNRIAYLSLMPVIVMFLGIMLLGETNDNTSGFWYAGNTFAWLGFILTFAMLGWWIFVTFFYVKKEFSSLYDVDAIWVIPITNFMLICLIPEGLIVNNFLVLMQIIWAVGAAIVFASVLILFYRILFMFKALTDQQVKSLPLMGYPIALLIFSYIDVYAGNLSNTDAIFIIIVLGISVFLWLLVYMCMVRHFINKYDHYTYSINMYLLPLSAMFLATAALANVLNDYDTLKLLAKPLDYFAILQLVLVSILFIYTSLGNFYILMFKMLHHPHFMQSQSRFNRYFVEKYF